MRPLRFLLYLRKTWSMGTPALLLAFVLVGCATEWGSKMRTSSEVYPAVAADKVEILFTMPARACKQIGIVSVMGSTFSSDVAMLKKLRKAAADLGANTTFAATTVGSMTSQTKSAGYGRNQTPKTGGPKGHSFGSCKKGQNSKAGTAFRVR